MSQHLQPKYVSHEYFTAGIQYESPIYLLYQWQISPWPWYCRMSCSVHGYSSTAYLLSLSSTWLFAIGWVIADLRLPSVSMSILITAMVKTSFGSIEDAQDGDEMLEILCRRPYKFMMDLCFPALRSAGYSHSNYFNINVKCVFESQWIF